MPQNSTTRRWAAWLPALAVPALIAGGILLGGASTPVDLPDAGARDVLALMATSHDQDYSGVVEQSSDLGLPELPDTAPTADTGMSSAFALLTADHSARVYVDGPERIRVQLLDRLAERDLVRNGDEVWYYDSARQAAFHGVLTGEAAPALRYTPAELARHIIDHLDPTTAVTVGEHASVAGRAAYTLTLTPRTDETLIGAVTVRVDAETGLPLSVDVAARGQENPAVHTAFTEIAYETPASDLFAFTPPPGTEVTERSPGGPHGHPKPTVLGEGWTTIVELTVGDARAALPVAPELERLTTPVPGGRLISTALVTVLLTDDNRLLAGAVPAAVLQAAATRR